MPNPNAVVSTSILFDPELDRPPIELLRGPRGLSVELAGGRRARLDPADPRSPGLATVLSGLRQQRLPVYLEIDPGTETITRLLVPHLTRVVGIEALDDGTLDVTIERSHARHFLRRARGGSGGAVDEVVAQLHPKDHRAR